MRLPLRYPAILLVFIFCRTAVLAQPVLSYSPSSNTYSIGTAIPDLNISNSHSGNSNKVTDFDYGTRTSLSNSMFDGPRGIGADASGNIYITNSGDNTIKKYSTSGNFSTFISGGSLSSPDGIVFDSQGNCYVLNKGNGKVLKYNSGGNLQSAIITDLDNPVGIAIDASDNLYVCDSDNDRVRKYSTSGSVAGTIWLNNNDEPKGVAINSTGDIFILLYGPDKVVKYSSSLVYQSGFSGITGLDNPLSLAVDGADNFYIGSSGEDKVRIYDQSGSSLTTISNINDAEGIIVDAKGNLYVSDHADDRVYKYPPSGGYFINAELPAGLTFNSSTGQITGTPTAFTPATTYIVYGYHSATSYDNTSVTITVAPAAPAINGAATGCSVTLTASGGLPAGGAYKWYNVSSGGNALASGSTYAASPGTYYLSYTYNSVESLRSTTTIAAGTSPILSSYPTGSGLYLAYPFNNAAADASSAGNTGTLVGSPTAVTDRYNQSGKAYSFNGTSQYITTLKQTASPGPADFSISVWFKTTTGGGKLVGFGSSQNVSGSPSSTYDRQIYMTNAGQIYYGIYPGSVQTISTATSYADGNWHHVVATTSTSDGSFLYVDGAVVAGDVTMTTCQSYAGYWHIGYDNLDGWTNQPSSRFFKGSLDDIAIYKSALTASQVYALYGAGSAPTCVGSPLSLVANSVSGATYSWSGPGGYTSTLQSPPVTANASAANAGTYTLTVTSATGCATTQTVTAIVNELPSSAFTATPLVNVGSNATITYSGTYVTTSVYTWDFNGGNPSTGSGAGPYTVSWFAAGTKTITLTVTNAAGCSSVSTQTVTVSAANYGNYGFKKPITLNTTTLGLMQNLTNFPALLTIQDNNLIISNTCTDKVHTPNGPNYDFAFTDANGSGELYYQVESYDQASGTLLVWVQIPILTYAVNNSILFFYGSPSPTVTHNAAFFQNTWASDYKAVYHFNEGTYSGSVTDGTAGGHTGTASGMSPSDLVTGKIGKAYSFNGSGKLINAGAVNISGNFTISAWVKATAVGVDQKILTNQASDGSSTGGYKLGIYKNDVAETESGAAGNRGHGTAPAPITVNTWHYIQGVFNGTNLSTYVDGVQYENFATTTAPSSTTPLYIGAGEGGDKLYFNGIIDEARVSGTAKSTDWLMAEYVNQNNPGAFTSAGTTSVITANAANVSGALTYTWKGVNNNVNDANNWDNTTAGISNQAPAFSGTETIVIPSSGVTAFPQLSGPVSVYGLTIAAGAKINLNGQTLNVGCNIYNSSGGQIMYGGNNTSVINWNGSLANQTYTGTNTSATASLGSMTINNTGGGTVTLSGGPVDIYNALTITSGNLAVGSSPAALTLKSTLSQTAYVAQIPPGSAITGTVKVERYIKGGTGYRGYRLLSSPVYSGTVSSNKIYDLAYLLAGMYITGTTGPAGGFDKTGNPTLYLYREDQVPNNSGFTTGNFWGISKINNTPAYNYYLNGGTTSYNLPIGNGMLVFFRGDRSDNVATETSPTYTNPKPSVLTAAGTLNQGQVVVGSWYMPGQTTIGYSGTGTASTTNYSARGYNLVGNPYASGIDWDTFNTTSPGNGIYGVNIGTTIWEFNATTRSYSTYKKGGASTNGGIRTIGSGQGFFVQASAANPQLIFNETAKVTTQNTTTNYFETTGNALATVGKTETAEPAFMRLELSADSVNHEDVYIGFDKQASRAYVFDEDAHYMAGSGNARLATLSADNIALAINEIRLPQKADTIRLSVTMAVQGRYNLHMTELKDVPGVYEIWLMDAYKKDSLDIKHNPAYAFDTFNGDTASFSAHRFSLVIRQNPALALRLLNFTAAKTTMGSEITWTTENEAGNTYFTVERSNDNGATFKVVGGYPSGSEGTYSLPDRYPPAGTDLYRLKMEDLNGAVTYSKTIALSFAVENKLALAPVSVYPNPAKNTINVSIVPSIKQIPGPVNVSYNIIITGSNGNVVQKAAAAQPEWQGTVGNLVPGSYVVQVLDNKNNAVVGQGKFIKL